ncbi:MAG: BPL-N domain-containing protein [Patescibacteria group bacterium]
MKKLSTILVILLFFVLIPNLTKAAGEDIWMISTGGEATIYNLLKDDYNVTIKTSEQIEAGVPASVELLVYPGGTNPILHVVYDQNGTLQNAIKSYINNGGSLLGSCGGSIPTAQKLYWDLGYFNMIGLAQVNAYDELGWGAAGYSGNFDFSNDSINGEYADETHTLHYTGGPAFDIIDGYEDDINVLATFSGNIPGASWDTKDLAAIYTTSYGDGKVVGVAPHPESNANTRFLFNNLITWALEEDAPEEEEDEDEEEEQEEEEEEDNEDDTIDEDVADAEYTPAKVKEVKVPKKKRKQKKVKVKWNAVENATTYAVKVYKLKTNKKTGKKKQIVKRRYKKVRSTSKWVKKLKPGTRYYAQVKAKRKINGITYPGKWSKRKRFKTKS